jgi:hypothetical protein
MKVYYKCKLLSPHCEAVERTPFKERSNQWLRNATANPSRRERPERQGGPQTYKILKLLVGSLGLGSVRLTEDIIIRGIRGLRVLRET